MHATEYAKRQVMLVQPCSKYPEVPYKKLLSKQHDLEKRGARMGSHGIYTTMGFKEWGGMGNGPAFM